MDQILIERINTKEQSVASAESVYVCAWGLISLFSHQCLYACTLHCLYACMPFISYSKCMYFIFLNHQVYWAKKLEIVIMG